MKTINTTLLICGAVLVALAFIFKKPISQAIIKTGCTDFEFYHVKLKICDEKSEQQFLTEKTQITKLITNMENKYDELSQVNSQLLTVLEKCNKPETTDIKKKVNKVNQNFKILKPEIDIYSKLHASIGAGLTPVN